MAAETKNVPIITSINFPQEGKLEIFAEYNESNILPDTLLASIDQEGESSILLKRFPQQIDYTLNNEGQLTVTSNSGDVNQYSINSEGELIYNI